MPGPCKKEEWQKLFTDHPQVLGLSGDLPEPNSFFTNDDLRKLIAKGDLIAVPKEKQFGEFDKSCYSLVKLPAVEKHGLLWVHPQPQGKIDLDELLGQELFNVLHKNSLAMNFYGNVSLCNTYKRNSWMSLCNKNVDILREAPKEQWDLVDASLSVYFIFPNIQLLAGKRGFTLVKIYPCAKDPNDSFSRVNFYTYPQDSPRWVSQESAERLRGFLNAVRDEDYATAVSSHKGVSAGAMDHVVFGRNEPVVQHFHRAYREALGMSPLEH